MTSFIKIKRYDKFYIVKRRVDVCNKRELINQGKFKLEVSCACLFVEDDKQYVVKTKPENETA